MRICASSAFVYLQRMIEDRREKLATIFDKLQKAEEKKRISLRTRFEKAGAKLEALDPAGVLDRGYAYVTSGKTVVSSAGDIQPGSKAKIHFKNGSADVSVLKTTITE